MASRQGGDVEGDEDDPDTGYQESQPRSAAGQARDDCDVKGGHQGRRDVRHRLADAVYQAERTSPQLRPLILDYRQRLKSNQNC